MTMTTEDSWRAVEYEYSMYFEAKRLKCREPAIGFNCNAMLELQLLHGRILADFVTRTQRQPPDFDDVLLSDLMPNQTTPITKAIALLKSEYGMRYDNSRPRWNLNKRLVHLTNVRGDRFKHGPLLSLLEGPLEDALKIVAQESGRDGILRWFRHEAIAALDNGEVVNSTSLAGMENWPPVPYRGPTPWISLDTTEADTDSP